MTFSLEPLPHRWVNAAFLLFALVGLRGLIRMFRGRRVDSESYSHTRATPLIITFASLVAAAVIGHHMFLRFRGLEIKQDRLELSYYWPRPNASILRPAFQRAEFVPAAAGSVSLYLYTQNAPRKSVPFPGGVKTNQIQVVLQGWRLPQ